MTALERINEILDKNGPEEKEYSLIDQLFNDQPDLLKNIDKNAIDFLSSKESIMGHILTKPYGYAGDFEIIDRIYRNAPSTKFKKWDEYSLSNSAAVAVRNRKDYFKTIIRERIQPNKTLKVLNIASGPARDVFEILEELANEYSIELTCVDLDQNAINYAKEINASHLDKIQFHNENILRFQTENQYDLVWSAGLFDYFNDKAFVSIIKRMKEWILPTGEIIIGNFNQEHNPSRNYMEIIGEWFLHHRSAEELTQLALQAGFIAPCIEVGREMENVNLFLHLKQS